MMDRQFGSYPVFGPGTPLPRVHGGEEGGAVTPAAGPGTPEACLVDGSKQVSRGQEQT